MQSRIEFQYSKDKAEGLIMVKANAWIGELDKETALGPWVSDEYFNRRLALEDLIDTLLNEIVSGHLRFKLASNGGYFERRDRPLGEALRDAHETQDLVLAKTVRQLHELMEENDRLDRQLQEARSEHEEIKQLLREAYAKIERQGGYLAQIRAITEKDT